MFAVSSARAENHPARTLLSECGINTTNVQVATAEGIVFLRGSVPDRDSVRQAETLLHDSGYGRVANLLTVAVMPDDDSLRRTVERALVRSRTFEGCRFTISARRGVVVLHGTVRQELQRDLAAEVTSSVHGVLSVVNRLDLQS